MFASERLRGQLLQINRTEGGGEAGKGDGGGTVPGYTSTVILEGMWKLLLGCVVDTKRFPDQVFVVGHLRNGSYVLAAVPVHSPSSWAIVAFTTHCGNGIRIHEATGRLYTSTEGTFLPGSGAVYEIDPSRPWGGQASVVATNILPADGLWIDQDRALLYVGLLPSAEVWTYNLTARAVVGTFPGLKHAGCELLLCAMDDFTLDPANSSVIVAATWTDNSVRSFPAFSPEAGFEERLLLEGVVERPTSVRWGSGFGGFAATSLFISEGGSLGNPNETAYRILEWEYARIIT